MKGVFSAPGDYVYFKSQVPLHKIPVTFSSTLSQFSLSPSYFYNTGFNFCFQHSTGYVFVLSMISFSPVLFS